MQNQLGNYLTILLTRRKISASCLPSLRAIAYKYRESYDRKENSDFLLLRQKDPFGELFSEIYLQSSSEFTFL